MVNAILTIGSSVVTATSDGYLSFWSHSSSISSSSQQKIDDLYDHLLDDENVSASRGRLRKTLKNVSIGFIRKRSPSSIASNPSEFFTPPQATTNRHTIEQTNNISAPNLKIELEGITEESEGESALSPRSLKKKKSLWIFGKNQSNLRDTH